MAIPEPLKKITERLSNPKLAPRICLILCPDNVRQLRILTSIRSTLNKNAEFRKYNCAELNQLELEKIFLSLENNSLFSSETHLYFNNIEELSAGDAKILTTAISSMPTSAVVIASASDLATNLNVYKFFTQENTIFSLAPLNGTDLEKWIAKELAQAGVKKFPSSTPSMIRQASQESPDRAIEIIEKIALYVEGDELSSQELLMLVPVEGRIDEFEFISKIATTKQPQLEAMMHQLLTQGVSPFPLLSLLHRNYSSYHALIDLLKKGVSPDQCSRIIGSPPWLVKKIAPLAQRYSTEKLRICLASIARADSLLKNKSLGHETIMSELLESLAT